DRAARDGVDPDRYDGGAARPRQAAETPRAGTAPGPRDDAAEGRREETGSAVDAEQEARNGPRERRHRKLSSSIRAKRTRSTARASSRIAPSATSRGTRRI